MRARIALLLLGSLSCVCSTDCFLSANLRGLRCRSSNNICMTNTIESTAVAESKSILRNPNCGASNSQHVRCVPAARSTIDLLVHGDLSNLLEHYARNSDVHKTKLCGREFYLISDPRLVREICVEQAGTFRNREEQQGCPMKAVGLTVAVDKVWEEYRAVLNPSFFKRDKIEEHSEMFVPMAMAMIEDMKKKDASVDLIAFCVALSQSILLRVLFSEEIFSWRQLRDNIPPRNPILKLAEHAMAWMELLQKQLRMIFLTRGVFEFIKAFTNRKGQLKFLRSRSRQAIRDFRVVKHVSSLVLRLLKSLSPGKKQVGVEIPFLPIVERRRSEMREGKFGHDDVLTRLIAAEIPTRVEEGAGEGLRRLSDEEICLILRDIMTAGVGSTGEVIASTVWEIIRSKEVREKVDAELELALGSRRTPRYQDLTQLTYLTSCVKEVLRKNAFASLVFRLASSDTTLTRSSSSRSIPVKKGSVMIMSPQVLGQDEDSWFNPSEFRPERFSSAAGGGDRPEEPADAFSFIPFGAGPRYCLGAQTAMAEVVLVTAAMLRNAKIRAEEGMQGAGEEDVLLVRVG